MLPQNSKLIIFSITFYALYEKVINDGLAITNNSSAEAFVWVNSVLNTIEKDSSSSMYSAIQSKCESAKGHTSISTFNEKNIIIGYLMVALDEINERNLKSTQELINEGISLGSSSSPAAYKWVVDVQKSCRNYTGVDVVNRIVEECNSARNHTSISNAFGFIKFVCYRN